MADLKKDMAARLRKLCRAMELAHAMTQAEVGARAGVHDAGTWSGYLSGRSKIPYETLVALWKAFGADTFWVIDGDTRNNTPAFNSALMEWEKKPKPATKGRRGRPPNS